MRVCLWLWGYVILLIGGLFGCATAPIHLTPGLGPLQYG